MDSRRALAVALSLLGFAFRLFALVLCALTVVLCFNGFAGYGLIPTPFGGVFRFDFAVVAAVCFFVDYLLGRISQTIR